MTATNSHILEEVRAANRRFVGRIKREKLPVARLPGRFLLVTCMDGRVNPEAIGVQPFGADGACDSDVRIVRTIGGMSELRSMIVGIHLAKIEEILVVMHTDCGCSAAWSKIDVIIDSLETRLDADSRRRVHEEIGEPFKDRLIDYLKAFPDPSEAVKAEVSRIKDSPFVPADVLVHGFVYDLATGEIDVVIDGSES